MKKVIFIAIICIVFLGCAENGVAFELSDYVEWSADQYVFKNATVEFEFDTTFSGKRAKGNIYVYSESSTTSYIGVSLSNLTDPNLTFTAYTQYNLPDTNNIPIEVSEQSNPAGLDYSIAWEGEGGIGYPKKLTLDFAAYASGTPASSGNVYVMEVMPESGEFFLTDTSLPAYQDWLENFGDVRIFIGGIGAGDGNEITGNLVVWSPPVEPVPEPTTVLMFGILGIVGMIKKKFF